MIYKIKVKPNSSENKIIEKDGYLEAHVKAKPEKGKANLALINLLSKYFPNKKIKLSGLKSKNKIVEIK